MAGKGWTPERSAAQRKAIYRWRPWDKSTGPKSKAGKDRVALNALKHGNRSQAAQEEMRLIRKLLRECEAHG